VEQTPNYNIHIMVLQAMSKTCLVLLFSLILFSSCKQIWSADPQDTTSPVERAERLIQLGDYQGAFLHLNQALSTKPDDPGIHVNLGWVYLYTDEPDKATEELTKAFALQPKSPKALHLKGAILSYLDQDEDARQNYQEALKADDQNPQLHFHLADSFNKLNQSKQALAEYEKALKLAPKGESPASYLFAICSTHYRLKDLTKAEGYCKQAASLATDPDEKQRITDFVENLKLLQSL
jgi:Flp pilus assembly protein TadD